MFVRIPYCFNPEFSDFIIVFGDDYQQPSKRRAQEIITINLKRKKS
jgi:phenylalanine-4-hydroxylase